jgi:hypothetical protein
MDQAAYLAAGEVAFVAAAPASDVAAAPLAAAAAAPADDETAPLAVAAAPAYIAAAPLAAADSPAEIAAAPLAAVEVAPADNVAASLVRFAALIPCKDDSLLGLIVTKYSIMLNLTTWNWLMCLFSATSGR